MQCTPVGTTCCGTGLPASTVRTRRLESHVTQASTSFREACRESPRQGRNTCRVLSLWKLPPHLVVTGGRCIPGPQTPVEPPRVFGPNALMTLPTTGSVKNFPCRPFLFRTPPEIESHPIIRSRFEVGCPCLFSLNRAAHQRRRHSSSNRTRKKIGSSTPPRY